MTELKVFKNDIFEVAIKLDNGEITFDAERVARSLGLVGVSTKSGGRQYEWIRWDRVNEYLKPSTTSAEKEELVTVSKGDFIPEPAVYKLAFKASNEVAEKFQDWLAIEVLPAIRKYGAYMTEDTVEKALTNPDFLIQLASRLKEEKSRNEILENENKELAPKAEYTDKVLNSTGIFTATEIAKDFGLKSAQALNNILNGFRIIRRVNDKWCLYAEYCGRGYAKDKVALIKRKDGTTKSVAELYWTEKGRKFIYDFLVKQELLREESIINGADNS